MWFKVINEVNEILNVHHLNCNVVDAHYLEYWTWEALKRWPSSDYLREILVEHIITINSFIISPFNEPFPTFWTKATPLCFIGELFVFMVSPPNIYIQTNKQQSTINNMNVKVELVELSFWSVSGFERIYIYYIILLLFCSRKIPYINVSKQQLSWHI